MLWGIKMKRLVTYIGILFTLIMLLSACGKSDVPVENSDNVTIEKPDNSNEKFEKENEGEKEKEDNEDLPTLERTYENWTDGYRRIIEDNSKNIEYLYDFIYIDDDEIPEMLIEIPGMAYVIYTSYKEDDADEYRISEGIFPYNISGILGYTYIEKSAIKMSQSGASIKEDKEYDRYTIICNGELVEAYIMTWNYNDSGDVIIEYSSIYENLSEDEIKARIRKLEEGRKECPIEGYMEYKEAIEYLISNYGTGSQSY